MFQEINIGGDRQMGKTYAAMKLAVDAAYHGERVLYDTDNVRMMTETFHKFQQMIPLDHCERVCRANGNESIRVRGGGEIIMMCRARGGGRGITADMHVIDHDRYTPQALAAVNPTVKRLVRTVLTPGDLAVVGPEC